MYVANTSQLCGFLLQYKTMYFRYRLFLPLVWYWVSLRGGNCYYSVECNEVQVCMFLLINFLVCSLYQGPGITDHQPLCVSAQSVLHSSRFLLCTYAKVCGERTFKFRIRSVMNICICSWGIYFKFFMHTYSRFLYVQLSVFSDLFGATVAYVT
jgi:hypothetical protein